ncbi:5-formyltetrahydrofolate cyclo-ligase [Maricaulis parjimensis]|uniref:5-formyltetrahydrofolate cyclo-ligase n=1 Tax=Maricaulis parjimensis TaxID=144023 RepID=UPI00193964C9|nr:5-formyltetrahydrofolate cyclo-ligase [Maricaulis parjimensis]
MSSPDSKSQLRRSLVAARLEAARARPDAAAQLVMHWPVSLLVSGRVVAGYRPLPGEMDPAPLMTTLLEAGARLALPVMREGEAALDFHAYAPGDPLERRAFGVEEPLRDAAMVQPDIVLVPLVGADLQGTRLGFGKGFYDRTLARLRAEGPVLAIGLAYTEQVLETLPADPHDEALDAVVTDSGFLGIRLKPD